MPEPIITPVAQRSSSLSGSQPEFSTASEAATIARWMKRSIFFWSLTGIHSARSSLPSALAPWGTCPATLLGRLLVSKDWMAPMPDSPLISRRQTCSAPTPSGLATPIPVTTTRRIVTIPLGARSGGLLLLDVVDRILHGADLLRRVLGDLDAERLLERHHQLDRVEAVGAQVIDERRLGCDLRLLDAEVLHHDLLNLVGNFAHLTRYSWKGPAFPPGCSSHIRPGRTRSAPHTRPGRSSGPLSMVFRREPTRPPAARAPLRAMRGNPIRSSPFRRSHAASHPSPSPPRPTRDRRPPPPRHRAGPGGRAGWRPTACRAAPRRAPPS